MTPERKKEIERNLQYRLRYGYALKGSEWATTGIEIMELLAHVDALQIELKETKDLLWRAEVPDMVPMLLNEVARLREALERIRQSDRTISGIGSTSRAQESWWLYGTFGFIAHQALEHMPVPSQPEESKK